MDKKRLFIGTFVNQNLFEGLYDKIKDDFRSSIFGKWVEIENLHFTIKFLGDVELHKIPEIKEMLKEELKEHKSELVLKGLSYISKPKKAKVLYVNIFSQDKAVVQAQRSIEDKLSKLRFQKEKRKFFPHVSLCRIKTNSMKIDEVLKKYSDMEIGKMPSFKINLISSELTKERPIYTILK